MKVSVVYNTEYSGSSEITCAQVVFIHYLRYVITALPAVLRYIFDKVMQFVKIVSEFSVFVCHTRPDKKKKPVLMQVVQLCVPGSNVSPLPLDLRSSFWWLTVPTVNA